MRERLNGIFHNVNEWLKFAEAKHGVLVVLNSGIAFGLLTIYKEYQDEINFKTLFIALTGISFSIVITLISLFPRSSSSKVKRKKNQKINLYFTGHLALLSVEEFKEELLKIDSFYEFDRLEEDLMAEIIRNASIASKKYMFFRYAVLLTITSLSVPLVYILSTHL